MNPFAAVTVLLISPTAAAQEPEGLRLQERTVRTDDGGIYRVQTGFLPVPENRSDPDSASIEIAFGRLRTTAAEPRPPLVYLAGGPGNDATSLVSSPLWRPFLELGDVILLDQRGIGRSRPRLVWATDELRPEELFLDRTAATAHVTELARRARAHHLEQGIDLAGYTAAESAADVEDLRRALELDRIALMGHSYGTHLGLEVIRRSGDRVDRFVSLGTAGTGDMHKLPGELADSLRAFSDLVAADPRIGDEVPDFFGLVEELLEKAAREPLAVTVTDPRDGREVEVMVGRFGLRLILVADLGDTADLPVLPRMVHSVLRGDTSVLQWFVQKRYSRFSVFPTVTFAVRGASGATAARWQRIAREAATSPFGAVRNLFSPDVDRALQTPDLGDAFRAPVRSEVPVLFVSGTLDAHTPPHQAERVRRGFPNSSHLIVVNAGHEDTRTHPEVVQRILAFLRGESVDATPVVKPALRFVPLRGHDPEATHPALQAARR